VAIFVVLTIGTAYGGYVMHKVISAAVGSQFGQTITQGERAKLAKVFRYETANCTIISFSVNSFITFSM
jgi:hypothetical protein